jgi:hypothetical protein
LEPSTSGGQPWNRSLDQWFQEIDVRPRNVAEIEDSALLKVFGQRRK